MKFGLGLISCQRYPGDDRGDEELYADALELAVEAEALGYDSIWVSEHHYVDDAYLPSVLPLCAAIAARTSTITIGTGIMLAPLHEPIRVAEDAAVVDLISRGRLVIGLGQGWRKEEFDVLGIPMKERPGRLVDLVKTLRQAWSGQPVTGGSHTSYPGPVVTPAPAQAGGPPIWLGASTEKGVRRAARIADGYMLAQLERVEGPEIARQLDWLRDEKEQRGESLDDFEIGMLAGTFAWPDLERGWDLVLPHVHHLNWKYETMDQAGAAGGAPVSTPAMTAAREEEMRRRILFEAADAMAATIAGYDEAAGGDLHYIARLYWPGLDPAVRREAMAYFAEEVIAKLR